MPLLSQPAPKPERPRRKRRARAAADGDRRRDSVEMRLGDTLVTALPDGALWIADAKTLIVSDLHLEKGSSFAVRGQMLPPYDTHAALLKLTDLMLQLCSRTSSSRSATASTTAAAPRAWTRAIANCCAC